MRYIHYSYILVLYRKNKEHTNDARIDKKKSRARSERDDDGFGFTLFLGNANRFNRNGGTE